ncbi:ATP-binding cassette, subfamily B (MDR TAP), member 1, partial [Fusarium agapanthi]
MAEISEKAAAATSSSSNPSRPSSSSHSGSGSTDKDAVRPHMKSSSDPNNEKLDLTKADSAVIVPPKAENIEDHYRHLPPDEAEVLRRQVVSPEVKQGVAVLYRYASRNDILIILISALCAIAGGAALPLMTVIFGNLQSVFQDFFVNRTLTSSAFNDKLVSFVLYFVYLGIGEFIVVYISTVGFIYTGEHLSAKIREHYLESCLRQNIGFFDQIGAGEVVTRITSDTNLIQDGISEKVSLTLAAVATFVSAFIIGFIKYWKLTLILFSTVVALLLNMGCGSSFILKYNRQSLEAYAHGGSLADEVISSIRNAVAFGTQERLARQYDAHLKNAEYFGFRVKGAVACMVAGMMMVLYLNYGLAFWQGSKMLVDGETSLSNILTILMAVMIGAFNLGNVAPNIQAFTNAVAAAAKIFNTIDRVSPLDSSSNEGEKLENIQGSIRLSKIKHIYPSRPEVTVMDDVSLEIPAGKVTALVGASGSGKSTIVGLVERFYDPVQGTVYLDGHDISKLNLRWLRQQMALVSQEPTLFGTTIFNNIRHGLIGTKHEDSSEEKQRELVIEAARKANAHDFVSSLPEKYETNVGERGFLLSGGQKQRIAIARAIVSDPKILLLDEATSALDTKSEGVVQAALENASEGRTTITIAHRLSTIRDAHNIVVMAHGRIVEQGTHNELLENKGPYSKLVSAQKIAAAETMTPEEQAAIDEEEVSLVRKMTSEKQAANIADPNDDIAARLDRTSTTKSASSLALQGRKGEAEQKYSLWTLVKLIASFNKNELGFML